MHVFSKILKGKARVDQFSLQQRAHRVDIVQQGTIIQADESYNLHEISAIEEVWMLDVMDRYGEGGCTYYKRIGNELIKVRLDEIDHFSVNAKKLTQNIASVSFD